MSDSDKALIVFQSKKIRRTWFKDEWYYSLVDIVQVLTDSVNPTDYLKKLRKRDEELGSYIGTNCPHIEMLTKNGKNRQVLAGNTKDVFRLIHLTQNDFFIPKRATIKNYLNIKHKAFYTS